jgi:type III secretion protein Q
MNAPANARLPHAAPFASPALARGLALLQSALSSRAALKTGPLRFVYTPLPGVWTPAARFCLEADGFLFRLDFAVLDFLAAHPALDGVNPEHLPEEARQAAIEMLLAPLRDTLENLLNIALIPAMERDAGARWLDPPVHFALEFAHADRVRTIPLRLSVETEDGARWLADRLMTALPRPWRNPESASWRIGAAVLAGAMRLPLACLERLAPGDILLPPDYPAAQGRLFLALGREGGFSLSVVERTATVLADCRHFCAAKESAMPAHSSNPANPASETTAENARPDTAALEVELRFELGKIGLPLAEVEALAPGKTFPLGMDPLSAVTVTLDGQALASARLVDLNGTLGVQITRLASQAAP